MCPNTKDKDGPGTAYSEDHGKYIKLLFMLLLKKYINTEHYFADNDGVIFEQDTNEDEYMFSAQGMLNKSKIYSQHYITIYFADF
jgi:hypothetical protein